MLVGKGFGSGLEMAASEMEHLSTFINVNQLGQTSVNQD
jgi:hypothetical protein